VPDEHWPALVSAADAASAPWADALRDLVPDLEAAALLVEQGEHRGTVRCHLDFNPQNVLQLVDGRTVVVDWENGGAADPEQELAMALAEFAPDPAAVPAFLRAYVGAGGRPLSLAPTSFAMTLAVQSHLLEGYATDALDPAVAPEERQRAHFWTEDITAHLWTPRLVDAWVEAAEAR